MQNILIEKIIKEIIKHEKIVLFHHVNPDGDSLSCSFGLMKGLQAFFPNKKIKWVADQEIIKKQFSFLKIDFKDVVKKENIDKTWLGIVGDTSVLKRIYGADILLKCKSKIVFDHHQNNVDFPCEIFWKAKIPASAIQAYQILKKLELNWTSQLATWISFGIITDTNRFQYSLTDTSPLDAISDLFNYIEDETIDNLYQNLLVRNKSDLFFEAWALKNVKYDSQIAYLIINRKSQEKLNLLPFQCKRNYLISNIENMPIWIIFIEIKPGIYKASIRSNQFSIHEIAKKYNGGGHPRASSCEITNNQIADLISDLNKFSSKMAKYVKI